MMRRPLLLLLGVIFSAEARVDFNHSSILDEYDFAGKSSVTVTGLCSDTCHIYASITPESRGLTNNILIQTAKGFTTLSSLADQKNADNNIKLPLEISNMPTLTIVNGNSGNAAGPLVVYIVNKAGIYFGNAEVYEAEGLNRAPNMVQTITIISARPFTLTESSYAPMGALARLTGFDALGYQTDPCPNLYYLIRGPFPGFTLTINSPIVSLTYDVGQFHFPVGELKATLGITNTHQMELSGFINSPGYHGCTGKPAYRSSLYDMDDPLLVILTDDDSQTVSYSVITNSDESHSLVVMDADGKEVDRFFNTGDVTPVVKTITDKKVQFDWLSQPETYLLVRYNSTAAPIVN